MRRADNPVTFMCRLSLKLGASTSWNPQGLHYLYQLRKRRFEEEDIMYILPTGLYGVMNQKAVI